jgi:hypothetical protein
LELRNSALFLAGVVGSSISIMLKKVFRKPKSVDTSSTLTTLNQLNEILEMLEKKEKLWQKKIAAEVTKAREYTQAKNKKAAIQCLKRKKLYEVQVEQLGNYQLRLHDQVSPPNLITLVSRVIDCTEETMPTCERILRLCSQLLTEATIYISTAKLLKQESHGH